MENSSYEKVRKAAYDSEYRLNNGDKIRLRRRAWYLKNRELVNQKQKKYAEENKVKIQTYLKEYRKNNPYKFAIRGGILRKNTKKMIVNKYGGRCFCCGEDNLHFLTLDHINNDGYSHRKSLGSPSGTSFYRWIIVNNYPNTFRVSCMNCNWGRRFTEGKRCPHELESEKVLRMVI